jgi:hypothetical protein
VLFVPEADASAILTGIDACCARAPSGHATAPPSSVMNSRRFIGSPQRGGSGIIKWIRVYYALYSFMTLARAKSVRCLGHYWDTRADQH